MTLAVISQPYPNTRFSRSTYKDVVQPQSGMKVAAEEVESDACSLVILIAIS